MSKSAKFIGILFVLAAYLAVFITLVGAKSTSSDDKRKKSGKQSPAQFLEYVYLKLKPLVFNIIDGLRTL
jgi:hypothetical protein